MDSKSPTELYLERLKPSGRSAMLSQLRQACRHMKWEGHLESHPFHSLSYAQLESLKQARLAAGSSSRTINHLLCAIRGITKIAFLSGLITEKQWLQVQNVKALKTFPSTRWNALASNEVCELLEAYRKDRRLIPVRNTAMLAVLLCTGLRRSELMALQIEQFNVDEFAIEVLRGKGGKPRVQYMPEWAVQDLLAWLAIRGDEAGYLFNPFVGEEPQHDRPLSATSIYKIVTRVTEALVDSKCSPHDMRRTYVSKLLDENVDLLTVCKMAGHSSVATTQIYDKRDEQNLIVSGRNLSFQPNPRDTDKQR